jgi:hypothetical protein
MDILGNSNGHPMKFLWMSYGVLVDTPWRSYGCRLEFQRYRYYSIIILYYTIVYYIILYPSILHYAILYYII